MKKDIEIPEVESVYMAAVKGFNEDLGADVWNMYIINNRSATIDMILVVSRGEFNTQKTSVMRRSIEKMEPNSYAKVEFLTEALISFKNEFLVTFFEGNKMYETVYTFDSDSIDEMNETEIPVMGLKGILRP
ncbi:hypothetical protein [Robertkochia solimangrovi]|uniref:hypothetical protein n=1 Tax=Robertkochia solimangrovi TaxID=2213046 RepID=UPI00117C35B5|nr:hypothetical protein [Robertkochia solimangrovi]TRZ45869.1 hypothetical protein DMZ48_00900 [Robertkochia solimangrovi]